MPGPWAYPLARVACRCSDLTAGRQSEVVVVLGQLVGAWLSCDLEGLGQLLDEPSPPLGDAISCAMESTSRNGKKAGSRRGAMISTIRSATESHPAQKLREDWPSWPVHLDGQIRDDLKSRCYWPKLAAVRSCSNAALSPDNTPIPKQNCAMSGGECSRQLHGQNFWIEYVIWLSKRVWK